MFRKHIALLLVCLLSIGLVLVPVPDSARAAVPSPWQEADIGSSGVAGSSSYSSGTFTVAGSGSDIYNTSDQFRFVYQPLSGDGTIVARVVSITNTHSWAKGAVMIRESLAANSKHAMTLISYSQGAQFSRRTSTGGSTATTNHTGVAAPYWVKLERSGDTFTSSISSNGVNWTTIGSQTISMASNVYIGLAVTSVNTSQLNTVVFDNVSVTVPSPDTQPPTAPTNLTVTGKTDTTVSLSWTASTDDVGVTGYRIYHSGSVLAGTTGGATTATVTNLSPNTSYTFTVKAIDAAENESAASNPVTVTTDAAPSFWLSGGSRNINSYNGLLEWQNFRGRPNTFQTVFSTRDAGWSAFVSTHGSAGQIAHYQDPNVTVMIQTAPFPTGVGATYANLVNGAYDSYWQQIGTQLKNRADAGLPVIISIAWEMNGEYMYWGCGSGSEKYSSPSQYIAAYRRIVNNLRVTYPDVETAWIINAHATPTTCVSNGDAWQLYPGDDYVTYIGIDNYDMYPPSFTKTQFDNTANANGGLYWLANHARQQGKQLIVGEWGIAPGAGSNGGGDNPNFIQWMFETFQAWHSEGLLKAEYYFADPIGGGNVDSDLIGGNPQSRAKYVSLYQQ